MAVEDVLRARPSLFPALASGSPCPTTPGRPLDPALVEVVGDGPVYVAWASRIRCTSASAELRLQDWAGQKTIWAIPPGYAGLVLVRGRQLDGPNELRFGSGNVPATELLFHAPGEARPDPPNGWTYEIDYTRVRAPGCYAYQIDGETFSESSSFEPKLWRADLNRAGLVVD